MSGKNTMPDEFYFDAVGETVALLSAAQCAKISAATKIALKSCQADIAKNQWVESDPAYIATVFECTLQLIATLDAERARADAAMVLAGQALAQNAALIHAAAECAVMRDRAIRERDAAQAELLKLSEVNDGS